MHPRSLNRDFLFDDVSPKYPDMSDFIVQSGVFVLLWKHRTLYIEYVKEDTGHAGKNWIHFGDAKADLDFRFWKSRYNA